jgi:hypothetical protein
MRFYRSYKLNRKTKILAAALIAAAYLLGFSARAYSPAHLGHHAIPIPTLIPLINKLTSNDNTAGSSDQPPAGSTQNPAKFSFNHLGITTTYFWVGEPAGGDNGYIANAASAWDGAWQSHFGGADAPAPRSGYNPAGFTPKENPFYFALPYNDLDGLGRRKASAASCPLAALKTNYSWCKNSWIAIRHGVKVVYAQWEDVGPFGEDDSGYVFGASAPGNKKGSKAGLDVSPAVRDYLGLADVDSVDWSFVNASQVPAGPWKAIITTTPGDPVE